MLPASPLWSWSGASKWYLPTGGGIDQPRVDSGCRLDSFLAKSLGLESGVVQAWSPFPSVVTFGGGGAGGGAGGGVVQRPEANQSSLLQTCLVNFSTVRPGHLAWSLVKILADLESFLSS